MLLLSQVQLFATPSLGVSRQEYWSGLPLPSPGDPPDPEIKLTSPALAGRFSTTETPGLPVSLPGAITENQVQVAQRTNLFLPALQPGSPRLRRHHWGGLLVGAPLLEGGRSLLHVNEKSRESSSVSSSSSKDTNPTGLGPHP